MDDIGTPPTVNGARFEPTTFVLKAARLDHPATPAPLILYRHSRLRFVHLKVDNIFWFVCAVGDMRNLKISSF